MKKFLAIILLAALCVGARAGVVIKVPAASENEDAAPRINATINKATTLKNYKSMVFRFAGGTYNIGSEGLRLAKNKNITIDGNGARLLTHGTATLLAIDSCTDITVRNFVVDAAAPAVAELTVAARTDSSIVCIPSSSTRFSRDAEGTLHWNGDGSEFTDGPALLLHGGTHVLHTTSPIALSTGNFYAKGMITFQYRPGEAPECAPYDVFQLFDPSAGGAAVMISGSKGVKLENITYHFNAGIKSKRCSDIELIKISCTPEGGTDRTSAGSSDFVNLADCSGNIAIADCDFSGAGGTAVSIGGDRQAPPAVTIEGCTFTLVPDNALRLESCRSAGIANNTFLNIPGSSIALSTQWAKISGNTFIDCSSPVISIAPHDAAGHTDIRVSGNEFFFLRQTGTPVIVESAVAEGVSVDNNTCNTEAKTVIK